MNKINTDLKYLISLWVVLLVVIIVTYANHGNLVIDCGREAYYPTQVLLGKILYKDIFNIYGPFAYMFNAFLFKLFGINLNILYISGCVSAYLLVTFIYLIARKFLSSFLSFAIGFYTISIGVTDLCLFNFIFPYSYSMLYGIVSFSTSLWALLKYQENGNDVKFLYLASLMAGICVSNKYEFLPYIAVVLYSIIKTKKLNLKEYYYVILSLLFVPVFCFGILFIQGLNFNDLTLILSYISKMSHSKTLTYFYATQGVYFHKLTPLLWLSNFVMFIIPFSLFILSAKANKRWFNIFGMIVASILLFYIANPVTFCFFPILTIILFVIDYKNIIRNRKLLILTLSCITISFKVLASLTTLNYGVFFASFLLITVLSLIFDIFKEKNLSRYNLSIGIYIIVLAMALGYTNMLKFGAKDSLIKTKRGGIFTTYEFYKSTDDLINYIEQNTKKTDKIVILPEGSMVNFLTDRNTDDFYTSLIPLYVEMFGEDNIIKHFKQTKPEYIIFNNWNSKDYYYEYICKDYAVSFCNYVSSNYTKVEEMSSGFNYLIYKKNKY